MTTFDVKVLHTRSGAQERAIRGSHGPVICVEAPAGSSMEGKPMQGAVLTVDGDYVCLIPIAGLASALKVYTECDLDGMTAVTAGPDALHDFDPRSTNVASAAVLTAGSGDGSLTDDTEQEASLTLVGGTYARFTLTVAGSPTSVTVTRCEFVGL